MNDLYNLKQFRALKRIKQDFWMMIQHGAKRTGKTILNNDIFLLELKRIRKIADKLKIDRPQYILAGESLGNIQRNILIELSNKYGIEFNLDKYNRFELFGITVCCFGHGTIRDLRRIRGMTAFGAYINEGTVAVEEVFKEILNRCSGEGARVIIDTNPDNPLHWLKVDYIDKADGQKIIEQHWKLEDNTFLTKRYVENIKFSTPAGVFYDRDIEGLWVNAEGVIYKDFNKDIHLVKEYPAQQVQKYIGGIDWGFEHYGSIVVIAKCHNGNYYLIEEIAEKGKYIDYWINKVKELKNKYPGIIFYADSARPEHVSKMQVSGLNVYNAKKNVFEGIGHIGSLLKQNKLYFLEDEFKQGLKEMYMYVWKKGQDEPEKSNDDVLDSLRYALFSEKNFNGKFKAFGR